MQRIEIGNSKTVSFSFYTVLSNIGYVLTFDYNYRVSAWYFGIADANGNFIKTGIRVKSSIPLLFSYSDDRLPPGELVVVDLTGLGAEPNFDNFDVTHVLTYEE